MSSDYPDIEKFCSHRMPSLGKHPQMNKGELKS